MNRKSQTKVTVGGVPEHFNLPWHLGIESGAFSDAGIDLEYVDYPGGTGAMMKALRSGEVDVAIALTEGCLADIVNGNPSRIVKTYVQSPLIWGIHVAAGSDVKSIEQMKGKRYAISRFGSGSHLMAIVDAAERGWPSDQIEFVVVGNLDGAREALADGRADIFFWERFTTSPYVASGEFRRLGDRETPWPAFVICAREEVIENHSDAIWNMLQVSNQQCRELMESSTAVESIADRYGIDQEQVSQWFSLTTWNTDTVMPERSLVVAFEYLSKLGIIDSDEFRANDVWAVVKP